MKCLLPKSSYSYIFMEHRLNTQHSVVEFIVDFSVVLQECSDRPNSGQLIYCTMKGFLCSIDTQADMYY